MRRLHYAGGFVLTADIMCKAVLRYARALAENGRYDVVSLPTVSDGGEPGRAHIFHGPSRQLFSIPVTDIGSEPIDFALIQHLERRTRGLQPSRPEWDDEMPDISDIGDDLV
jgi:hypothetical protein